MERINPHYFIPRVTTIIKKPMDCEHYAGASCLLEPHAPPCQSEDCNFYVVREKHNIITLCGSTRFKDLFLEAAQYFTLQGWVVLMPGVFGHADGIELTPEEKSALDDLHREKIRLSNAIFVLNYEGYIGESTQKEIEFAKFLGIPVYTYE